MKYKVVLSTKFKKNLKLAQKQHKDIRKLWTIVEMLSLKKQLPYIFKDHKLSGDFKNFRACHIEPDWVLVYCYIDESIVLYLYTIGSHSNAYKRKFK